jgi:hypothetical protein
MEIEEALRLARRWLKDQPWWSDAQDAIVSVERDEGTWVVGHTSRRYADTWDDLDCPIGGYGPVVVTDDGRVIPAEPDC